MTLARLSPSPEPPPFRAAVRSLFENARLKAFFFSLEGTVLCETAGEDDAAVIAETVSLLGRLAEASEGAVAVLGERSFAEIDRRLAPLRLPGCASGGFELRGLDGTTTKLRCEADLDPVRRLIGRPGTMASGVRIADEGLSIVLAHGDDAELAAAARATAREAVALAPAIFAMRSRPGVVRVGFAGASPARAMHRLMNDSALIERIPIVFGGGRADDEVHAAARDFGGTSIEVGGRCDHAADFALPGMNDVRWLMRDFLAALGEA